MFVIGDPLPVLVVDSVDDAVRFVNRRDKPLALYVFSERSDVVDAVVETMGTLLGRLLPAGNNNAVHFECGFPAPGVSNSLTALGYVNAQNTPPELPGASLAVTYSA